jgi:ppGpp synthetase/RelA/SpoT-type nucleotidyltranferase
MKPGGIGYGTKMARNPKPTLEEYLPWLRGVTSLALDGTARQYEINAIVARDTCQNHPFLTSIDGTLVEVAKEYEERTGAKLFSNARMQLLTKSYDSALNKSYRENVIRNKRFPDPPRDGGWLLPDDWFGAFDDIVRCQLICRYLDGPKFVAERLDKAAKAAGLASRYDSVQHDRGYYAYHFYVTIPVDLINADVTVEIQLTTQLQEMVYDLTHGFYEELRIQELAAQRGDAWKWEYRTPRFKAGYLSHTLHLLEGLIAEVRGERLVPPVREEPHERAAHSQAPDAARAVPPSDPQEGSGGGA